MSFRPVFLLLAGRTLGLAASFLIPVVLARRLNQEEFGTYKQVFLIFTTLWAIAQIGMGECLYYFVPQDAERKGRYIANSMVLLFAAGAVCLVGLVATGSIMGEWMSNPELSKHTVTLGIFVVAMLTSVVLEIAMISERRFTAASVTYVAFDLLKAAALVVPALIVPSVEAVMQGAVVFSLLRLVASVLYLRGRLRTELRMDWALLRKQLGYAMPFALAVVVETITMRYHQYAVSYYFDTATFAIYSVACLQIPLVGYAISSASDVLMVQMAEPAKLGEHEQALRDWHDAIRKLALLLFPVVAIILVAGVDIVVLLFTEQYEASGPLFKVASILILLQCIPTDSVLRVYAQIRYLVALNGVRLVVVAASIGWLVRELGLMGAMTVTVLGMAVAKVGALLRIGTIFQSKVTGILPWRALALVLASSGVGWASGFAVQQVWSHMGALRLSAVCVVVVCTHFVLAAWFGVLRRDEVVAVYAALIGRWRTVRGNRQLATGETTKCAASPES